MNETYRGGNKLTLGIVLGVITFWLFAQSLVNVVPNLQQSFGTDMGTISIAVSLTALFSGMFVVGAGGLADKIGRVKMTNIGLLLSIIGSALIIITNLPALLILGRIIQGVSAACIMPSTLAIMKTYYEGAERQRALSYWSIGSWGGSGICSLFGGAVATTMGWRWIFIFSIIVAVLSMLLIKGTPETKSEVTNTHKFDVAGLIVLVVMLLSLNVVITKGAALGYTSLWFFGLIAIVIVAFFIFLKVEKKVDNPLIDFKLFENKPYTGATISNFLLNGVAGTLIVANTFVQQGLGYTALQAGYLSITYLIMVLLMIRVGEKLLQKMGSKRPMLLILERLKKKIKNAPNAKIGIAYSPKSIPIINAVTVVPILAPIITPMACFNVINPAVTSPIVITVVPELLCIKIVTTIPAITPNTGFDVNLFKISRSLSPADA